jgi:hypothetical protein
VVVVPANPFIPSAVLFSQDPVVLTRRFWEAGDLATEIGWQDTSFVVKDEGLTHKLKGVV